MPQRTSKVNASEETIQIGPIGIRFLLTGDDSGRSASVFEFSVPAGERLATPAHKNDAYEETLYGIEGVLTWTVDGTPIEVRKPPSAQRLLSTPRFLPQTGTGVGEAADRIRRSRNSGCNAIKSVSIIGYHKVVVPAGNFDGASAVESCPVACAPSISGKGVVAGSARGIIIEHFSRDMQIRRDDWRSRIQDRFNVRGGDTKVALSVNGVNSGPHYTYPNDERASRAARFLGRAVLKWNHEVARSHLNQCQPKNAHSLTESRVVLRNRP